MRVAAVAAGCDQHRANTAGADRPDQTIEPGAGDSATGAAKIVVHDLDGGPAELTGTVSERILSTLALLIECQLIGRCLASPGDHQGNRLNLGSIGGCGIPKG